MIAHVIDVEGPIFEDVLVDRIARAHGMQRSGNQIRRRVIALLPAGVSRIAEGERTVIWPSNKRAGAIHFFRKDDTGVRGHEDVPLKELAAIAVPFIRLRMDDEVCAAKNGRAVRARPPTRGNASPVRRGGPNRTQFVNSMPREATAPSARR